VQRWMARYIGCTIADSVCKKVDTGAPGWAWAWMLAGGASRMVLVSRPTGSGKPPSTITTLPSVCRLARSEAHQHGWLEGNYYVAFLHRVSPDFDEARRVSREAGLSPRDPLCGIVTRRPAPAGIAFSRLRQARDVPISIQPVLFDMNARKQINMTTRSFRNPFSLSELVWRKDVMLLVEYNQRGNQVLPDHRSRCGDGKARA